MSANKLNVLLVDEDPAVGQCLVPDILEGTGHTVAWHDRVPSALEYIAAAGAGRVACDAIVLGYTLDSDAGLRAQADARAVVADIREYLGSGFPVLNLSTVPMNDLGVRDLYTDSGEGGVLDLPEVLNGLAAQKTARAA